MLIENIKGYLKKIIPVSITTIIILSVFYTNFFLLEADKEVFYISSQIVIYLYFVYILVSLFFFKKEDSIKKRFIELEREYKLKNDEFLNIQNDIQEYFLTWVHQIKTPITASKLIADSNFEDKNMRDIRKQLIYIEDYTNMALSYLKMINHNTDMDITKVKLDDIIRILLKKYSIFFISSHISLEYEHIEDKITTDPKWFTISLEQIISNSIKYTKNGMLKITYNREYNYLEVLDTGIGIDKKDLPKIFDKGYSGFNGRLNQKSSGIGLFLAKTISEKLGQKIDIQSEVGKGTKVRIYFPNDFSTWD